MQNAKTAAPVLLSAKTFCNSLLQGCSGANKWHVGRGEGKQINNWRVRIECHPHTHRGTCGVRLAWWLIYNRAQIDSFSSDYPIYCFAHFNPGGAHLPSGESKQRRPSRRNNPLLRGDASRALTICTCELQRDWIQEARDCSERPLFTFACSDIASAWLSP